MDFDLGTLHNLMYVIGEVTVIFILGVLLVSFVLVVISLYSIKKGHLYFPRLIKAGIVFLEGFMKAFFRLLGLEDKEMLTFFIKIHNTMNANAFSRVPLSERAVFVPQCLRSGKVPGPSYSRGAQMRELRAVHGGRGPDPSRETGYRIFIIPGSSFIKRMVKKYHPKAIIGVGCLTEVKEGIDMADKIGLVAMGVVTLKEGCVETLVSWQDIYDVATLGLDPSSVPEDLHALAG